MKILAYILVVLVLAAPALAVDFSLAEDGSFMPSIGLEGWAESVDIWQSEAWVPVTRQEYEPGVWSYYWDHIASEETPFYVRFNGDTVIEWSVDWSMPELEGGGLQVHEALPLAISGGDAAVVGDASYVPGAPVNPAEVEILITPWFDSLLADVGRWFLAFATVGVSFLLGVVVYRLIVRKTRGYGA
jgi:hypothetical protein